MTYATLASAGTNCFHAPRQTAKPVVRQIGIVLFEGFSLLGAGIVVEVFHMANEICSANQDAFYSVRLLSVDGGRVACSSSVRVWTDGFDARQYSGFDALFIAGGQGAYNAACDERLIGWLRIVYPKSDVVKALAEGRALVDAAGIAAQRTPLRSDGPFGAGSLQQASANESGDRYESIKSALTLVKRDLGLTVARQIAERLMPGASAKLMSVLSDAGATRVGDKVRASAQWLQENCERPISVIDAAQVVAMSERNFLRRFKLEMGITPSEYLLQARLDMTCRLLTDTELPVDKVARRSGMGSGDRLAKIFRKRLSISPSEYRARSRSDAT
jgi:transcriptional regulator GlxA family with amidase domain